jgi:hypothetical protein
MSGRRRASGLGPPETLLLRSWGSALLHAFGATPYLVGSVARAEEWRDVDVRLMLPQATIDGLSADRPGQLAALNLSVSLWGQRATGLPVEFQFQEVESANAEHAGPRIPIVLAP